MSKSPLFYTRGVLGSVALGSLLAAGCANPEVGETLDKAEVAVSTQALKEVYDGETLLRGIFFGRGPVAQALPEIWEHAPLTQEDAADAFRKGAKLLDRSPELAKADEAVLEAIEKGDTRKGDTADEAAKLAVALLTKQDPKFISFFQKSIYSGDPVLVSDAIDEAARRIHELTEIEVIRNPGRYGADYVLNENVAINVNAVINVNVAVNIDTVYNYVQFWSLAVDPASQLRNEMIVANITERFVAR